ncbi:MAG: hypothetical protein QOF97_2379, partial [Acidimicrobiaceae bacterium]
RDERTLAVMTMNEQEELSWVRWRLDRLLHARSAEPLLGRERDEYEELTDREVELLSLPA